MLLNVHILEVKMNSHVIYSKKPKCICVNDTICPFYCILVYLILWRGSFSLFYDLYYYGGYQYKTHFIF